MNPVLWNIYYWPLIYIYYKDGCNDKHAAVADLSNSRDIYMGAFPKFSTRKTFSYTRKSEHFIKGGGGGGGMRAVLQHPFSPSRALFSFVILNKILVCPKEKSSQG